MIKRKTLQKNRNYRQIDYYRGQEIDALFEKGINIEKKLQSTEFKSQILERVE
jgi:hypothetical protein